jgi:hypothetical protein
MNGNSSRMMRLHRGITLRPSEVDEVRRKILETGLSWEDSAHSRIEMIDLRDRLDELFQKRDLNRDDTLPRRRVQTYHGESNELIGGFPVICACGDKFSASFYACRHNFYPNAGKTEPVLVTFTAPLEDVFLDGRDWLYSIFGRIRSQSQIETVVPFVGPAIRRYLIRAIETSDYDVRCALCELAIQDTKVVLDHGRNTKIIGGRGGTVFRSAFQVRSPIPPERIVSVSSANAYSFIPDMRLSDFLCD